MSIQVPRRVHGKVTRHEPYGCYVDFGEVSDGLIVVTMIAKDDDEEVVFPPVGSRVSDCLCKGWFLRESRHTDECD